MDESLILCQSFQAKSKQYIYLKAIIIKLECIESFCQGAQQEYSSKLLKHRIIVKRIFGI